MTCDLSAWQVWGAMACMAGRHMPNRRLVLTRNCDFPVGGRLQ